jgi:hypothetical protein
MTIDEICTKYSNEDEWIQIDRLEIDLGVINPGDLEYNLRSILYSNIEREIDTKLRAFPASRRSNSKKISRFELVKYFLQKGVLPWWAGASEFNLDEICAEVLKDQEEEFYEFLTLNKLNEKLWKRISLQFTPAIRKQVVFLFDELVNSVQRIIEHSRKGLVKESKTGYIDLGPDVINKFILINAPLIIGKEIREADQIADKLFQEINEMNSREDQKTDPGRYDHIIKDPAQFKSNESEEAEHENRMIVKHAGIVLLSPFLKPFFSNLKLIKDDEWIDDQSRDKAIHLLRYIGTGEQFTPEYNLVLEKLLCGGYNAPIAREINLDENEKKEAEDLLLSVIDHWSDVLLESIPWGYATIILPWNNYIILVEW